MSDELTIELLDAVDVILDRDDAYDIVQAFDRGKLERLLSLAWLEGRKSSLSAAQAVYSDAYPE